MQGIQRVEDKAGTQQTGIGHGAILLQLPGNQLQIPGTDPAEPGAFRCQWHLPGEPQARHRAGIIGQRQRALPARAPPAIDSTDAQLPVADNAGQVGVVEAQVGIVTLAIHVAHRQVGGPALAHAVEGDLAGGFIFCLGREAGEKRFLGGTTQCQLGAGSGLASGF